jgi:septal ring factor EnvC (AmiA/AmiB activator)
MRPAARFVEHVKSPVSIRAIFLFIAIVVVLYLVWRDIADQRERTERYQRFAEQLERWQAIQNDTSARTASTEQMVADTNAQMRVLQEMNHSFSQMTKALQQAELDRQAEHKEIARQLAASARIIANANRATTVRRSRTRRSGSTCWATVTVTEKFGDADIIKRELRRVPCPK